MMALQQGAYHETRLSKGKVPIEKCKVKKRPFIKLLWGGCSERAITTNGSRHQWSIAE